MSLKLSFFQSNDPNPYNNLARELYLYETCQPDEVIFYLWQNEPTVVIGKNQSANAQCELKKMEQDKVHLARRITGGGAVYQRRAGLPCRHAHPCRGVDRGGVPRQGARRRRQDDGGRSAPADDTRRAADPP